MKTTITFGSDYCPLVISIEAKDGRLLQSCSPVIARDDPRGPAQNGAEIKTKTNREPQEKIPVWMERQDHHSWKSHVLKSYKTRECSDDIHVHSFDLTLCTGLNFMIRGGLQGGANNLKRNLCLFTKISLLWIAGSPPSCSINQKSSLACCQLNCH